MENRHKLKEATSNLHSGLESTIQSNKLLDSFDQQHYGKLLLTHLNFIENVLAIKTDTLASVVEELKEKKNAIQQDLKSIGVKEQSLNSVMAFDQNINYSVALGTMYVVMGSQMGNRMMYNHLKTNHPSLNMEWFSYLSFKSESSMDNWKNLISAINELNEEQYKDAEKGAINGFERFKELWLSVNENY